MTRLLASVSDREEARIALAAGADLIDLKDPRAGTLGALAAATVAELLAEVAGRRPVSATLGDLPLAPAPLAAAAAALAATGVDYVKVGFFAGGDARACARALGERVAGAGLVGVLFADEAPDFGLLETLAGAGFRGAMLDTVDKRGGGLRRHLPDARLREFVVAARALGLMAGLAGSLTREDIAPLLALDADILGFRGALCAGAQRAARVEAGAVAAVRALIPRA